MNPSEHERGSDPPGDPHTREMAAAIVELEALERNAMTRRGRNLWVQVSRVGTLGWLIALPIVGGALLGSIVDRHLGTGLTFTLALLVVGVALAGFGLWRHAQELDD
ncbi:putative F0F1-ATPase subunit [Enhygromyxa salina]|uniref:Putative F0F1-ATPase subunit n=1 Tax=Enhygromyxa salina TaxID=215803 RepID=A0A2S9XI77_9BACT|nr:AtpZ/AtpI family protein [Enhygromyxa salina]PRP92588.1 putative F0F1-ATPase subunit [Enhygromyxa salina]